jgi:drug/metabolite transporter (DMT)-like permease
VSRSVKAHVLLVLVTFVWGATFVVIKNALADMSPLLFNAVRMTLAAAALLALFRQDMMRLTRQAWWAGVLVGAFLWLGFEFQTTGLKLTAASKSGFLTGVSVVLVPVFLALFWRRHINRWTLLGVSGAFAGLWLLMVPVSGGSADLARINRGDLLTIGCAIAFAFQIILMGRAMGRFSFRQIATLEAAVCAALMWLTVPLLDKPYAAWTPRVLWAILITALLGTAMGFTVQAWAQQFTPPTHTALIFSLEPVFAWITSFVVLGERLGLRGGFGAVLILAGVLLSELKGSGHLSQAEETADEMLSQ